MFCYLNLLSDCVGERSLALQSMGARRVFPERHQPRSGAKQLGQPVMALVQVRCYS